ncbi:MAG: DUF1116 domain-containing protein [Nitrospira sp.]|nr:DUF1116 domain-containing protein [Nitrospira sp.]MDH5338001.1 DUF1116 domain-containing protein [Nitrospira sp.]
MIQALFQEKLHVLNIGLSSFADSITRAGGSVLQIEWAPPAQGQQEVGRALARLVNLLSVETANQTAFDAYQSAQPVLNGVGTASQVLPNIAERMILHSGPPIAWKDMCGPMKGAIVGAILYEGWTENLARAEAMASSGEIAFEPCHHHNAVGPMAGIISPSMPVWMVTNTTNGYQAFSNFNEGLGKALRFGANGPDVITRLKWMGQVLAPALRASVELLGGIDLKPMMAQALHMGDEVHNRNAAASSLFLKRLISALLKTRTSAADIAGVVEFIAGNDHFFLNLSMAACKAMTDAAHGVLGSSIVTAMARNGVEFGIRVSGTGSRWFTAPAPVVDGLFFPGYSATDAAPDLGDSAITETAGVGGFAMAASPAIVKFVGGTPQDAIDNTMAMTHITVGRNNAFTLPALNFAGSPAGIDIRKVVDTSIQPIINTGIAHREAGIGQIGAGITRAPLACFTQAVSALAHSIGSSQ